MTLKERIDSFILLGDRLRLLFATKEIEGKAKEIIEKAEKQNPWFIPEFTIEAIKSISDNLTEDKLYTWLSKYPLIPVQNKDPKKTGVIMAGNIPLVGFHDFLCTLITGNIFIGKPSSKDGGLFQFIADTLLIIDSRFEKHITVNENQLKNIDAIIATGSDNTARYFEYYFSKYPHIIRKNRNSIAILSGNETPEELKGLAKDIFLYFGLGCRSISKLFVPMEYDFTLFFETIECYNFVYSHNKYANNYDYYKAVFLMNQIQHLDNGFLLLKEDTQYSSPLSVLYYEKYSNISDLIERIKNEQDHIQCITSSMDIIENRVAFGQTQYPELSQYADNLDTLDFLLNL
ncbi:MAG: hypothetical protein JXB49_20405 [Bacteroidales bacterium]|nr:hypothetical protein [Bacteroidales bacterium]